MIADKVKGDLYAIHSIWLRELLRFSEDQFVVWERPAPGLRPPLFDPKTGRCPPDEWSFTSTPAWK